MTPADFRPLAARVAAVPVHRVSGHLTAVQGNLLHAVGLDRVAVLGDRVRLKRRDGRALGAEVVRLDGALVTLLPEDSGTGLALGDPVEHLGAPALRPSPGWIGHVLDAFGAPVDGRDLDPGGSVPHSLPHQRRGWGDRLDTGLSVFDTFLPLVRGQRIGLFAGSGVGKTTLLGNLARHLSCDVVVVALIGERGREVRDMVDRVLGPAGMRRSVVFSATSDQSPLLRRRAALSAMHCAEHYRAQGFQVLFLLDSLTRLAEAQREIAVAVGEPVALRGFPASVVPLLTGLCERAGPGGPGEGDMTAIFSVLVAGSDMDEPVADLVRGIVDGHVVLDRAIAERGRFPAIDVLASVSRSLEHATSVAERALLADARACLAQLAESRLLLQSGLYASGSDPNLDRAVRLGPALDRFLAAPARGGAAESFTRLVAILGGEEGLDGR